MNAYMTPTRATHAITSALEPNATGTFADLASSSNTSAFDTPAPRLCGYEPARDDEPLVLTDELVRRLRECGL